MPYPSTFSRKARGREDARPAKAAASLPAQVGAGRGLEGSLTGGQRLSHSPSRRQVAPAGESYRSTARSDDAEGGAG
jgi:hypothetical protein